MWPGAGCGCTGTGPGADGLARLPKAYGTCAAWDDGDSAHACGSSVQCNELYPDTAGLMGATWTPLARCRMFSLPPSAVPNSCTTHMMELRNQASATANRRFRNQTMARFGNHVRRFRNQNERFTNQTERFRNQKTAIQKPKRRFRNRTMAIQKPKFADLKFGLGS